MESGNPSQDSNSTQKIEGTAFRHTAPGSAKKIELKSQKTENSVPPKQQKMMETVIVPKTQGKELMYVADEKIIQKASSEVATKNGKTLWRELNEIKASKGLEKGTLKVEKQQSNADKTNLNRESGKDAQANGRKQVEATNREKKVTVKGRTNDLLLNNMLSQLEQAHERSEVDSSLQEEKEGNGNLIQSVKKHTNKKDATNQKKSQNHLGIQKPYALLKYRPQEEQQHREKQLQHREKHILEARLQKGGEAALKNSSKPSHDLTNSPKKQGFRDGNYNDLNHDETSIEFSAKVKQVNNRKPGQITSPRNQQCEPVTGKNGVTTMTDQKSVHKLTNEKEAKQERVSILKEADARIISSNDLISIIEPLDVIQQPHPEAELSPTLYASHGGKVQSLQESVDLVPIIW
ncbi:uncharacterized protein LOC129294541 [Prosopis cineraria]|uniref:uncharacterized protein LOC129294541 n=1 Tax=Prosopis cineraria TaxID=364024 RepID=UPI00240ED0BA|nr:uncharacterized protein LOC129294541 [Prosopis cineraria]